MPKLQNGVGTSTYSSSIDHTLSLIPEQLERIFASKEFRHKDRLRRFLRFLVKEALAERADQINGTQIALEVFDRDEHFDPQIDPIVRVQAGRLRRALKDYYLEEGMNDPVRIDIPKGRYVPKFVLVEDVSGKGQHTDRPLPVPESKHIAATLSSRPSIAVLPFTNMSKAKSQEFFADGLTEEIIVALSRFQDFRVFGRHSTLRYMGQPANPQEIGRDLGVQYILTGSVRMNKKMIRVSAQLLDATSGECLWSDTYDRDLAATNILQVQDEITKYVTSMIGDDYGVVPRRLAIGSIDKHPTKLGSYEAVLHFHHYIKFMDKKSFLKARRMLERAVQDDSDYALAWAMLAQLHCDDYAFEFTTNQINLEKILLIARKSVMLDPMCQRARLSMAYIHFHRCEKSFFLNEIERVLALNPNAAYMVGFSGFLIALIGEWERGLDIMAKGELLNPYRPAWLQGVLCLHAYNQGDYTKALTILDQIEMPDLFWFPLFRAAALGRMGRTREAKAAVDELVRLKPDIGTRCRELISRLVKVEDLLQQLCKGLREAGLDAGKPLPPCGGKEKTSVISSGCLNQNNSIMV